MMNYRPEIDGLRAVAVLPVILFHAGFELFSGGFIGVDIFFVVSGYLITTIIISEMADGNFSIVNFYERRARRILPALFFVMAACLPPALFWMVASDLKSFGQSLIAVSTFSSNILFWSESGYFDTAAELKPLLHTWSLAVEEQYYIIFPIFLMLTWRFGIKWILVLLSLVFILSLGVAHWGAVYAAHPKILSGTFFLLPTRGWELLVGVFAAFYLKYNPFIKSQSANQLLSLSGLSMIIYAISTFDETTPFPSLYALVPVLGTGLLILCAVPKTFVHSLLSIKPLVGIGLISYSAYLWHQPLLSFARLRLLGEVSEFLLIGICIASLTIAWFSWRFVERPFRSNLKFRRKTIFSLTLVGLMFFVVIGFGISESINIGDSWSSDVRQHDCLLQGDGETEHSLSCYEDDGGILLWGDSHAASLSIGLAEKYAGEMPFTQLTQSGCPPVLDLEVLIHRKTCNQINRRILNDVKDSNYRKIILHAAWVHQHYPMTEEEFRRKMILTLDELLEIEGIEIVIVGNVPRWNSNPFQIGKFEDNYLAINGMEFYKDRPVFSVDKLMVDLQPKYKFVYFSVIDSICTYQEGERYCPLKSSNQYLYRDWGHLTRYGSEFVASSLGELFN